MCHIFSVWDIQVITSFPQSPFFPPLHTVCMGLGQLKVKDKKG